MPAEVETMFYFGQVPWHGLGKELGNPATGDEGYLASGLTWEVTKTPIFFTLPNQRDEVIQNKFAVIRTDRKDETAVLGIVGKKYQPISNKAIFDVGNKLVGPDGAIFHTAGSLRGGQFVWALMKLPGYIEVTTDDVVDKYLLITNCHNGTEALRIRFTPIRVVCMNTLNVALRGEGITVRVWHSGNTSNRIDRALDLLGITNRVYDRTADTYRLLASKTITTSLVSEYLTGLMPKNDKGKMSKQGEKARDSMLGLFENGKGSNLPGIRGTVWQAYNGVTEYLDQVRLPKSRPDRRLYGNWFGSGASIRAKAFKGALALVK